MPSEKINSTNTEPDRESSVTRRFVMGALVGVVYSGVWIAGLETMDAVGFVEAEREAEIIAGVAITAIAGFVAARGDGAVSLKFRRQDKKTRSNT